jgi:NAD(P)-dependent dehydrogenase (short-subunit alcohol dehydrogenase family)
MSPPTVLVTGAEGALGQAVVERFLSAGQYVLATTRGSVPRTNARIAWVTVDLADAASVRQHLVPAVNSVQSLVHCAGGFRYGSLSQLSDEDLDFLLNANLRSAILVVRAVLPAMSANGFGRVVLVSSRATLIPGSGIAAYAASKAGLNAFAMCLAEEVKAHNINVNVVLPSMLDTPQNRSAIPNADFSTWVKLDALAEIIYALTQPGTQPINGALIGVPGRL